MIPRMSPGDAFAEADVDERPDDRAHHLAAERRAADLEAQVRGVAELRSSGPDRTRRTIDGSGSPSPTFGLRQKDVKSCRRSAGRRPRSSPSEPAAAARTAARPASSGFGVGAFQMS